MIIQKKETEKNIRHYLFLGYKNIKQILVLNLLYLFFTNPKIDRWSSDSLTSESHHRNQKSVRRFSFALI
ncbi:MAG: hypothetical protein A2540_10570 [Sulfurimonas sp. RIFOXYD2_FULL_37_8]|nr:MAG: hypothetical protein A2540_10570 [Sulfurimonas sp. RIFOXYD2_FULL_37_8]